MTLLIIYTLTGGAMIFSLIKDRKKSKKALLVARRGLLKSAPGLLGVLGIVGLTLGILTPETIGRLLGEGSGWLGTLAAAIVGGVTLIPSLVAFPLAGSLLRSGATVTTISAFVTTLVMVGVVTAPMEIEALGRRFTLLRNGLGFLAALAVAAVMGVLL